MKRIYKGEIIILKKFNRNIRNTLIYTLVFIFILSSSAFASTDKQATHTINIIDNIKRIEDELTNMGTNVINELNKSIDYYENILVSEDLNNKQIVQINSIIKNLNEQINEYKNYSNQENYSLQNNTRAVSNAIYSTAVSAVISWFNAQGYVLSAELLTHARGNTSYNSLYVPYNGRRVIQSPVYKNIVQQSSTSGKGVFPNSGTVVQRDLFYSIHEFHWSKHNYGNVTIIDKYDFSEDLNYEISSIAGVAIRTMYEAQQHGVITPYGIKITN